MRVCRRGGLISTMSGMRFSNQILFCTVLPSFHHFGIASSIDTFMYRPCLLLKPCCITKHLPFLGSLLKFSSYSSREDSSDFSSISYPSNIRNHSHMLTPARVHKLIANQKDALLAMEIFEVAYRQPGFKHSYSTYHTLICKLGRARQFKAMEGLIQQMRKDGCPYTPGLFVDIIEIYGEVGMPNEAVKAFHQMLEFGYEPLAKHFNVLLIVLIEHKRVETALSLFRRLHEFGITPNTRTYNILIRAHCHNDKLSHAYFFFNKMHKQGCIPDAETYSILMQGLCRKSQVKTALGFLDEMINKGYVPDALTYNTLLNSLCRKMKLREAYRLLSKMKVMGCNPDLINFNTVITGFCREGRALDACQILRDMPANGCLPNALSYRTLVNGLCNEGKFDEAKEFMEEMISNGFIPHISIYHLLIIGLCNEGRVREACEVLVIMTKQTLAPHESTWSALVTRICEDSQTEARKLVDKLSKDDWRYSWETLQGSVVH